MTASQSQHFFCCLCSYCHCIQWSWQILFLLSPQKLVSVDIDTKGSAGTVSCVRMVRSTGYSSDEGHSKTASCHLPRTRRDPAPLPSTLCSWKQIDPSMPSALSSFPSGPRGTDPLFYLKTLRLRCGLRKKEHSFSLGYIFPPTHLITACSV